MSERKVLLGLIGTNIMGSLSPALFADAFVAAGIDGFYHLMDVDRLLERQLAKLLDAAKATDFAGTNITYPFKQEVIAFLDAVDPEAAQIGAVNTVAIGPEGRTTGYNFDRRGWDGENHGGLARHLRSPC
jgi:shikimate dehydrogenase